jgi:hypothetical protein
MTGKDQIFDIVERAMVRAYQYRLLETVIKLLTLSVDQNDSIRIAIQSSIPKPLIFCS